MSGNKHHDYHLVDPSPWPLIGAFSAGSLAVGLLVYFKTGILIGIFIGLAFVLATMFAWWRDVIREAEHRGDHTPIVQLGHRYGVAFFIVSELMFFAAFFWAFFNASLFPVGGVWPPAGVETFDPLDLPLLNTFILLLSGTTVTWAHHALIEGDREGLKKGLLLTVLLGISFTVLQAVEYMHAPFKFGDGIYSSTFFMATGFHGFHVIIGTIFLAVCYFRARAGHFKPGHHFGLEAAAWYWHFVDVVWLFLFFAVYTNAGTILFK